MRKMHQVYLVPSTIFIIAIAAFIFLVSCVSWPNIPQATVRSYPQFAENPLETVDYYNEDSEDSDSESWTGVGKGRRHLMIFTTMRSGSSFVGELFQQNPDFFYMFEPLKLVSLDWSGYVGLQTSGPEHVNRLLNCEFQALFREAYTKFGQEKPRFLKSWTKRAFCGKLNENQCTGITADYLGNLCKQNKHIALKTILLNHVQSILPLLQDGVYVIHLMRDPRGMINSMKRINFKQLQNEKNFATNLCRRLQLQIDYTTNHMIFKIKRYVLARYEDVALNPKKQTHKLYKFLNLDVPPSVIEWIESSTKVNKTSGRAFSTKRNSSRAAQSWRNYLSWDEVKDIQSRKECREVLHSLGYTVFRNAQEYRDMSISTVGPLPRRFRKL